MHARSLLVAALVLTASPLTVLAEDDVVKDLTKLAGKDGKIISVHASEALGTLKVGHGKAVVAYASSDSKRPFCIQVVRGEGTCLEHAPKRAEVPFAVVMTNTPSGFTVFFQNVEEANENEAHTYMVQLDKDGKVVNAAPSEVQVPWALGDAAWNGNGYHLALFYTEQRGTRLSMVSLNKTGVPEQHPDWASAAGMVSEVHLVASGNKVRAFYRGGMGERLLESDVTKIREWGSEPPKAKNHGALGSSQAIAITASGAVTKLKRK